MHNAMQPLSNLRFAFGVMRFAFCVMLLALRKKAACCTYCLLYTVETLVLTFTFVSYLFGSITYTGSNQ